MGDDGSVMNLDAGVYVHADSYAACLDDSRRRITEHSALSVTASELRKELSWPAALWARIMEDLQEAKLVEMRGNTLILTTRTMM